MRNNDERLQRHSTQVNVGVDEYSFIVSYMTLLVYEGAML